MYLGVSARNQKEGRLVSEVNCWSSEALLRRIVAIKAIAVWHRMA